MREITKKSAPVASVLKRLRKKYGGSQAYSGTTESPFKCLIGTILSAHTKDAQTEKAADNLFAHYDTPEKLANAPLKKVRFLIKPSGFYKTKAKNIKKTAQMLLDYYNGRVPDEMNELLKLPGVGRKVAGCVLVYAFNKPQIPVDTHVFRLSHRFGWSEAKTPEKTEFELEKLIPKHDWIDVNNLLVLHGQNTCKPLKPLCLKCVLNDVCPSARKYYPKGW